MPYPGRLYSPPPAFPRPNVPTPAPSPLRYPSSPVRTPSPSPPQSPNDDLPHYKRELIRSLAFPGMNDRQGFIIDAPSDTFQWMLDPGNYGGFTQWLVSGNGIFWVSGKTAIGKSTFMKHISQDSQTLHLLASWSRPKPCVVLSHYFWGSGHALQKSLEGLLRSLISQILSHNYELVATAFPSVIVNTETSRTTNYEWGLDELVAAFKNITRDDNIPLRICIFIDGLDEYDGDHLSLVELLQSISSPLCIKMCVASRPLNVFVDAFGHNTQNIQLEDVIEKSSHMSDMVGNSPDTASSTNFSSAESVFSVTPGTTSATTSTASVLVKPAREVLVEFLLEDVELLPLLTNAATDPNIGWDRLAGNFRMLLNSYSRDLRHVAENHIQREAAKFVQHNSAYISDAVRARLVTSKEPNISHLHIERTEAEQKKMTEEQLNKHLEEIQKLSFSGEDQTPPLPADAASFLEDNNGYDDEEINNSLTRFKKFLGFGSPLENLRKGLRTFVQAQRNKEKQPANASNRTDLESPTHREQNARQPEFVTSMYVGRTGTQGFQSLPILVDRIFDLFLPSQEPPIPDGKKRVRWICKCGTRLFDDFIELKPGAIEDLEAKLQQHASASTFEALRQQGKQLVMRIGTRLWDLIKDPTGLPITNTPANQNSAQAVQSNAQANQNNSSNSSGNLRLLLCIEKGDFHTYLQQKIIDGYSNDKDIFRFLHREYYNYRKFRTWFAIRGIGQVSLTRFKVDMSCYAEVHKHSNICGSSCFCLPPKDKIDTEYRCDPAPKVDLGYTPAISPNRLTHYFRNPECVDDKQMTIYAQLPKRSCGELLALGLDEPLGWGIYFQEGWHWRTIYVIAVVFLFCFSLIFGIVWSVTKADIQGAFAISSFWLTLASILFGYLAIRSR